MGARECFVINENTKEKRSGRREVLQKSEGGQTQVARGVTEPNQWQPRYHAGRDQKE